MPVKPAIAGRRVMVVMVDDQFDARPQSGLSDADVVWQAPAEGGIPRYMALFQTGDPPAVGPVRSSRLYFIAWASEWRSVYVHAGGSPQAKALLASSKGRGSYVYDADEFRWGGAGYLWRIHTRSAPHNVYTDGKHLRRLAKRVGAEARRRPEAGLELRRPDSRSSSGRSAAGSPSRTSPTRSATSTTAQQHLPPHGHGREEADRRRHEDPDRAEERRSSWSVRFAPLNDGSHKHRLEAQVTGTGKAWISTNGKTIRGTWKKPGSGRKTQFFDRNGKQVTLTRGQTFIQVVPLSAKITVTPGQAPTASTTTPIAASRGPIGAVGRFIS